MSPSCPRHSNAGIRRSLVHPRKSQSREGGRGRERERERETGEGEGGREGGWGRNGQICGGGGPVRAGRGDRFASFVRGGAGGRDPSLLRRPRGGGRGRAPGRHTPLPRRLSPALARRSRPGGAVAASRAGSGLATSGACACFPAAAPPPPLDGSERRRRAVAPAVPGTAGRPSTGAWRRRRSPSRARGPGWPAGAGSLHATITLQPTPHPPPPRPSLPLPPDLLPRLPALSLTTPSTEMPGFQTQFPHTTHGVGSYPRPPRPALYPRNHSCAFFEGSPLCLDSRIVLQ